MKQSLNGSNWTLEGYKPFEPYFNLTQGRIINFVLPARISSITGHVPGSVHDDLLQAGMIKDPYIGIQSLDVEWVENRDWVYKKTFQCDVLNQYTSHTLVLEGINHHAYIVLNGKIIGEHFNVNTPCQIDVTHQLKKKNTLEIVILETVKEQGQIGGPSTIRYQTQYFGYGWDFGTRLVGLGIHRDVYILHETITVQDIQVIPTIIGQKGKIILQGKISHLSEINIIVKDEKKIVSNVQKKVEGIFSFEIWIDNVKSWHPNGQGFPHLYQMVIQRKDQDSTFDVMTLDVGFKTVRYLKNEGAKKSLPYTLEINGEKTWIRGVCMTNLDHMIGRITDDDYLFYVLAMKDMNVNLVRLWGGGVREHDRFYELCDHHGIMVWQDFFQSQSSALGLASQDRSFCEQLSLSAIETIKKTRNHVSTVIYCGGNELKDENMIPLTFLHPNITTPQKLVKQLNPQVFFYPTTPSGPNFGPVEQGNHFNMNHNVHGPYTYQDNHYRHYNHGDWQYLGEFGINALSSIQTLKKIIPYDKIAEINQQDHWFWSVRNSGWWNSSFRDSAYFGNDQWESLEQRIIVSQWIQAEGVAYAIERNRSRAFQSSGNNIWQLNEPWPNIDCTSLIDYYKFKKLAFYAVKKAYAPLVVCAVFDDVFLSSDFQASIEILNFVEETEGQVNVTLWDQYHILLKESYDYYKQGYKTIVTQFNYAFNKHDGDVIILHLSYHGTIEATRTYLFKRKNQSFTSFFSFKKQPKISSEKNLMMIYNPHDEIIFYPFASQNITYSKEPWAILYPHQKISIEID